MREPALPVMHAIHPVHRGIERHRHGKDDNDDDIAIIRQEKIDGQVYTGKLEGWKRLGSKKEDEEEVEEDYEESEGEFSRFLKKKFKFWILFTTFAKTLPADEFFVFLHQMNRKFLPRHPRHPSPNPPNPPTQKKKKKSPPTPSKSLFFSIHINTINTIPNINKDNNYLSLLW